MDKAQKKRLAKAFERVLIEDSDESLYAGIIAMSESTHVKDRMEAVARIMGADLDRLLMDPGRLALDPLTVPWMAGFMMAARASLRGPQTFALLANELEEDLKARSAGGVNTTIHSALAQSLMVMLHGYDTRKEKEAKRAASEPASGWKD